MEAEDIDWIEKASSALEQEPIKLEFVDTHGQSPWHFTVQALLDLNAHFTNVSTRANPLSFLSAIHTCLKHIQEFSFTHGQSPWYPFHLPKTPQPIFFADK